MFRRFLGEKSVHKGGQNVRGNLVIKARADKEDEVVIVLEELVIQILGKKFKC